MLQYWWFNFQSTFLSFYMIFLFCFSSQRSIWNESQHIYCIIFVDGSYGLRCLFYLHLSLSLSLLYSYHVVFSCVLSCANLLSWRSQHLQSSHTVITLEMMELIKTLRWVNDLQKILNIVSILRVVFVV